MEADDGTTCIDKIMRKIDWKILKDIKLPIGKNKYLKRLDWYIIKKFLGTYVFAIALIISIAVVFDFNEKMTVSCLMKLHGKPLFSITI